MATLPQLDRIDPADAWRPWRPSASDPWNRKWAAHLYRRAGFGANEEELGDAERMGFDATLDRLMHGQPGMEYMRDVLQDAGRVAGERDDTGDELRAWWLYAMLFGGHPLREKMTLFWHNHFATSIAKVQNARLMFQQNCTLRTHALGKFGAMLQAVSRDPAMLIWLDSNRNVKGKPNENYARELMELFSLGVGNYTEHDVRQAARAFTGWHSDGETFHFDPRMHDFGPKTFLGRTGPWDGGDIVRIILEQPAAARFLVRKLYHVLISENAEPSAALLEPLCVSFRRSDYDIASLVRTMLSSRLFFSQHAFRRRIKNPVEYVVGTVHAVYRLYGVTAPDEYRPLPPRLLVRWVNGMGQPLFAPPNVKGWPGAQAWLNTSTVLERDNFAAAIVSGSLWAQPATTMTLTNIAQAETIERVAGAQDGAELPLAFDPARRLRDGQPPRPDRMVDELLKLYVPGEVRPHVRAKLTQYLAAGAKTEHDLPARVREVVHVILTMPEYQLA